MSDTTVRKALPEMGLLYEPYGWPVPALQNALSQQRQEAERQRKRADRLAATNRRLTVHLAGMVTLAIGIGGALLLLGLVVGYAIGVGLIGLAR